MEDERITTLLQFRKKLVISFLKQGGQTPAKPLILNPYLHKLSGHNPARRFLSPCSVRPFTLFLGKGRRFLSGFQEPSPTDPLPYFFLFKFVENHSVVLHNFVWSESSIPPESVFWPFLRCISCKGRYLLSSYCAAYTAGTCARLGVPSTILGVSCAAYVHCGHTRFGY